jgi:superfamily I DNA and/or RNA helicase
MHDLDSPSFFNPVEAAKVAELVKGLLLSSKIKCNAQEIAVISAFRKQVRACSLPLESN